MAFVALDADVRAGEREERGRVAEEEREAGLAVMVEEQGAAKLRPVLGGVAAAALDGHRPVRVLDAGLTVEPDRPEERSHRHRAVDEGFHARGKAGAKGVTSEPFLWSGGLLAPMAFS
jgi:hypothetical protein